MEFQFRLEPLKLSIDPRRERLIWTGLWALQGVLGWEEPGHIRLSKGQPLKMAGRWGPRQRRKLSFSCSSDEIPILVFPGTNTVNQRCCWAGESNLSSPWATFSVQWGPEGHTSNIFPQSHNLLTNILYPSLLEFMLLDSPAFFTMTVSKL